MVILSRRNNDSPDTFVLPIPRGSFFVFKRITISFSLSILLVLRIDLPRTSLPYRIRFSAVSFTITWGNFLLVLAIRSAPCIEGMNFFLIHQSLVRHNMVASDE